MNNVNNKRVCVETDSPKDKKYITHSQACVQLEKPHTSGCVQVSTTTLEICLAEHMHTPQPRILLTDTHSIEECSQWYNS